MSALTILAIIFFYVAVSLQTSRYVAGIWVFKNRQNRYAYDDGEYAVAAFGICLALLPIMIFYVLTHKSEGTWVIAPDREDKGTRRQRKLEKRIKELERAVLDA